ncbi:MAG: ABC transporter substrate-binding protein, partial [Nitrososphaerales archaeon]
MNIRSRITIIIVIIVTISVTSMVAYQQTMQVLPRENAQITSVPLDLEHAKLFSVSYVGENKILVDGANRTIILTPVAGVNLDKDIRIPVTRMVIFSSTHAALIDRLGIVDRIVVVAWGGNYEWYINTIKDGLENGRIKDIGSSNSPNYDEIVSLEPDLVVLVGGISLWEEQAKKLDELGIDYVVNSEWLEDDPLGYFEWIKFFSLFTNDEDKASAIFTEAKTKTLDISQSVSKLDKPDVLWAAVFRGTVYVPKAESYAGKIINMANGNYIFSDVAGSGSAQISLEELISRAGDADVLIYSGGVVNSTSEILAASPLLKELHPIQTCNVYAFQPWYWQRVDRVDYYMNDMAAILHPDEFKTYELKQFKKV